MENTQKINNKGFFKKLSDGDFGLAKTYWLYGVLVSIVWNILIQGAILSDSIALIIVVLLVTIIYSVFLLTGVWNASNRYTGLKIWAILAKIYVVLSVITLVLTIFTMVSLIS